MDWPNLTGVQYAEMTDANYAELAEEAQPGQTMNPNPFARTTPQQTGVKCRTADGSIVLARAEYYKPHCSRWYRKCTATYAALLPAVTNCSQRLYRPKAPNPNLVATTTHALSGEERWEQEFDTEVDATYRVNFDVTVLGNFILYAAVTVYGASEATNLASQQITIAGPHELQFVAPHDRAKIVFFLVGNNYTVANLLVQKLLN
jgi:hypothetical protein